MEKKKLTAANGRPIADNQNSQTAGQRGPVMLQDPWLIEKLAHFDREVIPERRMMPEVEDLTMHLAELAKVNVVPHSLIRFADGELAYITKRIDRTAKGEKLPMEDMCQLSERLTEYKYKGSYEKIAKIIMQYSSVPKLDVINFWEQVVFSWLTGNADMHLKNFSLYSQRKGYYSLTPGYDMISTALLMPEDTEELALTLYGKRRKIKRSDFEVAMNSCSLENRS